MSPLYNRLCVNTAIFSIQRGGNQLLATKYQPSLKKAYTLAIVQSINNDLKPVGFKRRHSQYISGSGGGFSVK